jgi:hypothetical protein
LLPSHHFTRFYTLFFSYTLADPISLGRALRNGKKYAEFINEAITVSAFAIRDMITCHASGPQDESDAHSDGEDNDDFDIAPTPPA